MELRDYLLALRRYWTTWVGVTVAALAVATGVVLITLPTYQATAQVFVASLGEGTSGSQFVNQRVTSYPEVARSNAVLEPVIRDLDLTESVADLRTRIAASNPAETSQIDIAVSDTRYWPPSTTGIGSVRLFRPPRKSESPQSTDELSASAIAATAGVSAVLRRQLGRAQRRRPRP